MKTTSWDELMRYAPADPCAPDGLAPETAERIWNKTMRKLQNTNPAAPRRAARPARPARLALFAAVIVALLCATSLAAYHYGWFGFDRLFGEKTALLADNITSFDAQTNADVSQPTYTEQEQAMIDEGTMQVPDIAELSETGVSAETEDFTVTLETMVVSEDSLYAIVRVEAKNEEAAACLSALETADTIEKEQAGMLRISARNNTGTGHEREWKNGGMSMDIVQVEGSTAYALLCNNGGEFEPGDKILFQTSYQDTHTDLFEVPVPAQLETKRVLTLRAEVSAESYHCWQTATITPISLRLDGRYGSGSEETVPVVVITLTDGTSFELANVSNGFAESPYGSYGSLSFSGTGSPEADQVKFSWLFSQLIDLDALASVTIDGVTYPVNE